MRCDTCKVEYIGFPNNYQCATCKPKSTRIPPVQGGEGWDEYNCTCEPFDWGDTQCPFGIEFEHADVECNCCPACYHDCLMSI